MKKMVTIVSILVLMVSMGFTFAQGGKGGNGKPDKTPSTPVVKEIFEIGGVVEAVSLGIGQGSPSLTIDGYKLILGPFYYLEEAGFEVEAGDEIAALVFESVVYENTLVAVEVNNVDRDLSIVLRDDSGRPVWSQRGRQSKGQNQGRNGSCAGSGPDMEAAETLSGMVSAINSALGQKNPTIEITAADTVQVVTVGPMHVWFDSEFSLEAGDSVKILAVPSPTVPGSWVAAKIENLTTGETLVLRDDTGIPVQGRGQKNNRNNQNECPYDDDSN